MPKVTPNFNEEMRPIEPGAYLCKIISSELKYGKESHKGYINWKLETQPEKRTVYHSTPIEGPGAGMFKHFVHCCGDKTYQSGDFDTDTLTGQMVSMELEVEEKINRSGKPVNYIKVINVDPPTMEQLEGLQKEDEDVGF
jgi:hypothetical protein